MPVGLSVLKKKRGGGWVGVVVVRVRIVYVMSLRQ